MASDCLTTASTRRNRLAGVSGMDSSRLRAFAKRASASVLAQLRCAFSAARIA